MTSSRNSAYSRHALPDPDAPVRPGIARGHLGGHDPPLGRPPAPVSDPGRRPARGSVVAGSRRRASRSRRRGAMSDIAGRGLAAAVRLLPPHRREWGLRCSRVRRDRRRPRAPPLRAWLHSRGAHPATPRCAPPLRPCFWRSARWPRARTRLPLGRVRAETLALVAILGMAGLASARSGRLGPVAEAPTARRARATGVIVVGGTDAAAGLGEAQRSLRLVARRARDGAHLDTPQRCDRSRRRCLPARPRRITPRHRRSPHARPPQPGELTLHGRVGRPHARLLDADDAMGHLARVKAEAEGTLLSTGGGALELVYRSHPSA